MLSSNAMYHLNFRISAWAFPLVLLAAILSLHGCSERPTYQPLPSDAVVLALGDSITAGLGASPGEDYPARLAELTGLQVVNAGVSGDTAREARQRLAPLLARFQPALVIVELGGNDFLRRAPPEKVKHYLREIVLEVRGAGARVALVAVPRLSLLRASVGALADAPMYEELAAEEGVILIPNVLADVLSNPDLRADEIHPNAEGYRQLAAGIYAVMARAGVSN